MAVSYNIAAPASVLFIVIYISVFILSTVGNTCVLLTCYKTLKRRHSPFIWLLVNLATADLLFTLLSAFNVIMHPYALHIVLYCTLIVQLSMENLKKTW